jgi:hypothetical protein
MSSTFGLVVAAAAFRLACLAHILLVLLVSTSPECRLRQSVIVAILNAGFFSFFRFHHVRIVLSWNPGGIGVIICQTLQFQEWSSLGVQLGSFSKMQQCQDVVFIELNSKYSSPRPPLLLTRCLLDFDLVVDGVELVWDAASFFLPPPVPPKVDHPAGLSIT